jgi:hypothetical protein
VFNIGTFENPFNVYLVGSTPKSWIDGEEVQFTRRFANIPQPWFDYQDFAFSFPGVFPPAVVDPPLFDPLPYRLPFTATVTAQIEHSYVLAGVTSGPDLENIVLPEPFRLTSASGTFDREFVSQSTAPDYLTYAGLRGSYSLVTRATLRPYLGNIYEKQIWRVQAQ